MSLQLVLGGSGSGKSNYVYSNVIQESVEHTNDNYIIIVPEQYTMETQKKLVSMHPQNGILNIDIVSFQRLAYKIFEELGGGDIPVLDDTGKNLIIRRVMEKKRKELKIYGNSVNKVGFISEMKSVISELLQYGVGTKELAELLSDVDSNQLLGGKLNDIHIVFDEFKNYIESNYITAEEILDVLCNTIIDSKIVKNSTIVLDGFTGFTPIQYRLLGILLKMAKKGLYNSDNRWK